MNLAQPRARAGGYFFCRNNAAKIWKNWSKSIGVRAFSSETRNYHKTVRCRQTVFWPTSANYQLPRSSGNTSR